MPIVADNGAAVLADIAYPESAARLPAIAHADKFNVDHDRIYLAGNSSAPARVADSPHYRQHETYARHPLGRRPVSAGLAGS